MSVTGTTGGRYSVRAERDARSNVRVLDLGNSIELEDEAPSGPTKLLFDLVSDDDGFTALDHATGMYGIGETPDEAFHDLFESLRELMADLSANAGFLTPELARDLEMLRRAALR